MLGGRWRGVAFKGRRLMPCMHAGKPKKMGQAAHTIEMEASENPA